MRAEGPGCNAPSANGVHVTAAREAALSPGTCSLKGAGQMAAWWPPASGAGAGGRRGRARLRGRLAPALALHAQRWPFLWENVPNQHLYLELNLRGARGLLMHTGAALGPVRARAGRLPACAGLPRVLSQDRGLGQPWPLAGRRALLSGTFTQGQRCTLLLLQCKVVRPVSRSTASLRRSQSSGEIIEKTNFTYQEVLITLTTLLSV